MECHQQHFYVWWLLALGLQQNCLFLQAEGHTHAQWRAQTSGLKWMAVSQNCIAAAAVASIILSLGPVHLALKGLGYFWPIIMRKSRVAETGIIGKASSWLSLPGRKMAKEQRRLSSDSQHTASAWSAESTSQQD